MCSMKAPWRAEGQNFVSGLISQRTKYSNGDGRVATGLKSLGESVGHGSGSESGLVGKLASSGF